MQIHQVIKEIRKSKHLKQKQVAEGAGLNITTYVLFELGKLNCTLKSLWRILNFLGYKIVIVPTEKHDVSEFK